MSLNTQGIRIDPAMLDGTVYRPGDTFDLTISGDKIMLVKSS